MPAVARVERTPYRIAARELRRATLLDAARDLIGQREWAEITMAEIADAAGVSRQTLYSEFGSRGEFAQALFVREADRFLESVERAIRDNRDDPLRALAAAFEVFLTTVADDPLARALVAGGEGNADLLPYVTTHGEPVVAQARARLAAVIRDGWPRVAPDSVDLLADSVVRLAISYAALPTGPPAETAASVASLLGPYLERALEAAGER